MKLAFREYGEGRPLLILHGLFGQSDNWNTLAKAFAEEGFRVFTIDQRNHGLSPHSEEWNYDWMADDLQEFITTHGLKLPVVLGHSMGAKTAMFFEQRHPGLASGLVLADMAARASAPHHDEVLAALNAVDFSRIRTRKEAEATLSHYISDFGTKQFLLKNIYWKENEEMAWRFNLAVITKNYAAVLQAVPPAESQVNTLIIRGGRSNYVSDADAEELQRRFPASRLVTIPGAGHWVHAEKPKEFFEAVLQFLKS